MTNKRDDSGHEVPRPQVAPKPAAAAEQAGQVSDESVDDSTGSCELPGDEAARSQLEDREPLNLAEDALAEFANYDSLADEYPEDDEQSEREGVGSQFADDESEDASGQIPPKQRRVAEMRLEARVEAVIFASQKPIKSAEILEILGDPDLTEDDVDAALKPLVEFYEDRCGGFRLRYLKRLGYQFQTAEDAGAIMERMFASRPRPISRAALETLSIIAYRQPVTRAEVEFIRGVDAGSIFKTLLERDLIKCVGRKEIIGRPMLFGTTDNFLTVFNLSSIKDLPPRESFQPAREMVQGAMEKLAEGEEGGLVDVEEYIADNTRGEYEDDDLVFADEGDEPVEGASAYDESEGQTQIGDDEDSKITEDGLPPARGDDEPRTPPVRELRGLHGNDADSEMALPAGDSIPEGGGELDR